MRNRSNCFLGLKHYQIWMIIKPQKFTIQKFRFRIFLQNSSSAYHVLTSIINYFIFQFSCALRLIGFSDHLLADICPSVRLSIRLSFFLEYKFFTKLPGPISVILCTNQYWSKGIQVSKNEEPRPLYINFNSEILKYIEICWYYSKIF